MIEYSLNEVAMTSLMPRFFPYRVRYFLTLDDIAYLP